MSKIKLMSKNLTIHFDEYDYKCTDGCCDHYGIITSVNGVEMQAHNTDKETILRQILEHLGYTVEIINLENGKEI